MGIPPDIHAYTNHCPRCFTYLETPSRVILAVGGIEKSPHFPGVTPQPPGGSVWLHPTGIMCEWLGWNLTFNWAILGWYAFYSQVIVRNLGGSDAFVQSVPEICERYFINAHQNPFTFAYNYGFAVIITIAETIKAVETAIPYFEDGARFEITPGADRKVDIRYANLKHRQNIIIQFDIDEIT